jgi:hypothetical protein
MAASVRPWRRAPAARVRTWGDVPRGDGMLTHELPPREGSAGRLRRVRGVGPRRGGRQAHLLRPLRPAAPRPGVGRHRGQRRPPDPGLQGHGPGLPGLRRGGLASLQGHLAIGHCRYSTTGSSVWENAQPTFGGPPRGTVALGHNGNLTNTHELRDGSPTRSPGRGAAPATLMRSTPPTPSSSHPLLAAHPGESLLEAAASRCCRTLRGAFSLVFMDEHTLYAARDPQGHPPAGPRSARARLGRRQRDRRPRHRRRLVVREVEPGELIAIDETACAAAASPSPSPRAACSSTSTWPGRTPRSPDAVVHAARVEMGRSLAP